jgi:sucrose phosphorylase
LNVPSDGTTFFNFSASHDGIGVRPVEGILSQSEIQGLIECTLAHGGHVSYSANPDGTQSVYELNISFFDALSDPAGTERLGLQVRRFLVSQAIVLSLVGVPGIYVHSLFGSRSHRAGVRQTGQYRSINREKFKYDRLKQILADPSSLCHQVFYPYLQLIRTRTTHRAFHPNGAQRVLGGDETGSDTLFVLVRTAPDGGEEVLCIHNVSNAEQPFSVNLPSLDLPGPARVRDLITGVVFPVDGSGNLSLRMTPYQVVWLEVSARSRPVHFAQ